MGGSDEPARSVEIEVKFDVEDGTPVPDLSGLPGVAAVTGGEHRSLDARYFDTADRALARAGVALRRRTGGADAGWHIKGPLVDGARVELHWPLGEEDTVPRGAQEALSELTGADVGGPDQLVAIARIRNDRVAYHLLDVDGGIVAELADDHVRTRDERSGVERRWREWELELGAAAPTDADPLFTAAAELFRRAGAGPASSRSKLARALGAD